MISDINLDAEGFSFYVCFLNEISLVAALNRSVEVSQFSSSPFST